MEQGNRPPERPSRPNHPFTDPPPRRRDAPTGGGSQQRRPASQGQRPASQGQRPASQGQRPASQGQRPASQGQRPASQGQGQRRPANAQAPQEGRTRPKKPKKSGIFSNPLFFLLFVFGLSAILAALGWTAANDVLALNKPYVPAIIAVSEDDSFGDVVDKLKENGMIEYKFVFRLFAGLTGGKDKITPGVYNMDTDMDYRAILNAMSARSASRAPAQVTIPEGYNIDQIFALLEESNVSTVAKLRDMAATHDYAFSFLQDIPLGDYKRLEGYLFPDTYYFYMGENPRFVINKMLVNFDAKLTDALRNQITEGPYTIHEMITIASMIEKEATANDRKNVSSVIHNRLEKPNGETNSKLEIDATLQYVLPEGEKVTQAHYQSLDSPYNTYLHQGLPPGPISNPGMASILAAMNPEKTGYYYYSLGDDGEHRFFKTYAEHIAFLNR